MPRNWYGRRKVNWSGPKGPTVGEKTSWRTGAGQKLKEKRERKTQLDLVLSGRKDKVGPGALARVGQSVWQRKEKVQAS